MKPRLLDLFCGAGGCSVGYARAGFDVVGVDIAPQPRYMFDFCQTDAFEYVDKHGLEVDVIHASPPCQGYSVGNGFGSKVTTPRLIAECRNRLTATNRPFVIENVIGAKREMANPVMLCGAMFGIGVVRHRLFETNFVLDQPAHVCHGKDVDRDLVSVTAHGPPPRWYKKNPGIRFHLKIWKDAMGIDWMIRDELREAIPPVYTEYIGEQLLTILFTSHG